MGGVRSDPVRDGDLQDEASRRWDFMAPGGEGKG